MSRDMKFWHMRTARRILAAHLRMLTSASKCVYCASSCSPSRSSSVSTVLYFVYNLDAKLMDSSKMSFCHEEAILVKHTNSASIAFDHADLIVI